MSSGGDSLESLRRCRACRCACAKAKRFHRKVRRSPRDLAVRCASWHAASAHSWPAVSSHSPRVRRGSFGDVLFLSKEALRSAHTHSPPCAHLLARSRALMSANCTSRPLSLSHDVYHMMSSHDVYHMMSSHMMSSTPLPPSPAHVRPPSRAGQTQAGYKQELPSEHMPSEHMPSEHMPSEHMPSEHMPK